MHARKAGNFAWGDFGGPAGKIANSVMRFAFCSVASLSVWWERFRGPGDVPPVMGSVLD
jgi:hypothetical protein